MTRPNRRQIEVYAQDLARRMGLMDWRVGVLDGPPPEECAADVRCVTGRKIAEMRVSDATLDASAHDIRYYVVHELVHCQFGAMHNYLDEAVPFEIRIAYTHPYEYGVDGVASIIAPFMPLPRFRRP